MAATRAHADPQASDAVIAQETQVAKAVIPQDQREAERVHPDPRDADRIAKARARQAPLLQCASDSGVSAYLNALAAPWL